MDFEDAWRYVNRPDADWGPGADPSWKADNLRGAIYPPGDEGYNRYGLDGAVLEIPALPKAVGFRRQDVEAWLSIMIEMEKRAAQDSEIVVELPK